MLASKRLSLIRTMVVNNGSWKLFSLAISILIYFFIRADISHKRTVTIPVETEFDPVTGGAAIESVEPRSVQVTLRGSYSDVNQLTASSLRCVLRPKQKGKTLRDAVEVKMDASCLRGARGVRVVSFEPGVAVVKFDVPVTLRLAVEPPAITGKARGRVELVYEQTNAVVKGSRRVLSLLDAETVRIQPEPIDVDGRSQTFTANVKLLPPGGAENAVVDPGEMVVNVRVISEKATVRLDHVAVIVLESHTAGPRWRPEPAWVDIDVTGRSEVVKDIRFGEVTAFVNASANATLAAAASNAVPVVVHVRQGLSLDDAVPTPGFVRLVPVDATPGEMNKGL